MSNTFEERKKRCLEIIEEYCVPNYADIYDDIEEERLARYLLVERGRHHDWASSHEWIVSALAAHDDQEYPEDWSVARLVDLDTEKEYETIRKTSIVSEE
jgi:hypothetical protein